MPSVRSLVSLPGLKKDQQYDGFVARLSASRNCPAEEVRQLPHFRPRGQLQRWRES